MSVRYGPAVPKRFSACGILAVYAGENERGSKSPSLANLRDKGSYRWECVKFNGSMTKWLS